MNAPRESLAAIEALVAGRRIRILHLSSDHERTISLSGMRRALPEQVRLLSGPGCAASICPEVDVFQAISLAVRHPLTVLAADNLIRLPLSRAWDGPRTLLEAQSGGADVRAVSAPIEALLIARAEPQREMVYFAAGFETLLAPFAGMVLEGLPDNLSVLLCGRRVEPLLESLLAGPDPGFDALMLPGNRCALTGTAGWEGLSARLGIPVAVSGYTGAAILTAIHALLRQYCSGGVQFENCYRALARPEGNATAIDRLHRVFDLDDGGWRGLGSVAASAYRFRQDYRSVDADHRYPDYRAGTGASEMPEGCDCAAVLLGRREPVDCQRFLAGCLPGRPYGPCMASDDGSCNLRGGVRAVS